MGDISVIVTPQGYRDPTDGPGRTLHPIPLRDWSLIMGRGGGYKMEEGRGFSSKRGGGDFSHAEAGGGGAHKVLG